MMLPIAVRCLALALAMNATQASTAAETTLVVPSGPAVSVTGAATGDVANDRMTAVVRVESENASAGTASNDVNTRMAKALAKAKAAPTIDARSVGYTTYQTWEKGKPSKWKVVQSLQLQSGDFAALAGLLTRLQDEDGLLVSGMSFSVAPETRRKAEDALTREAIRSWRQRATTAAEALGYADWRVGRLSINTGDAVPPPRPLEMMAMRQAAPAAAPVAVEAGTTQLTVTVSGEAMLETLKPR